MSKKSKVSHPWGWGWSHGWSAGGAWAPTDIAGLDLWLKADAITGLSDGDPVATWSDQSGNGNDVAQSTTAKKPTYKTSIVNSLPVVRFDGTDDGLVLADSLSTATEGTIFVVFQLTSGFGDSPTLVASCDEAGVAYFFSCRAYVNASYPNMEITQKDNDQSDAVHGSTTITNGVVYLAVFQSDGTAYSYRLNDANETEAARGGNNLGDWLGDTSNRDSLTVGLLKVSVETQWLKGDMGELIVYDTSLSAEDLSNVETYLNNRWAAY